MSDQPGKRRRVETEDIGQSNDDEASSSDVDYKALYLAEKAEKEAIKAEREAYRREFEHWQEKAEKEVKLEAANAEKEALLLKIEQEKAEKEAANAEKEAAKYQKRLEDECVGKIVEAGLPVPLMNENPAESASIVSNEAARNTVMKFRVDLQAWKNAASADADRSKEPPSLAIHEPAEILGWNIRPSEYSFTTTRLGISITSCLKVTATKAPNGKLEHHNITNPQDYVKHVIEDVLKCLGLNNLTTVVKEPTLFSLRPHLVVVIHKGRLLFAVEIKNPGGNVFDAEVVGGQCLDYLKGMKQQGNDQPFVLLTTYNQSAVVRLAEDDESYNHCITKGAENAKKMPNLRHQNNLVEENAKEPPNSSPRGSADTNNLSSLREPRDVEQEELVNEQDERLRPNASGDNNNNYDYRGRKVKISQVVGVERLYQTVALMIESSLVSLEKSSKDKGSFLPKEGDGLDAELCTLYEDGFSWEQVRINCANYSQPPLFKEGQTFHVLSVLGQGRSGRTLLCSSSTGRIIAAKLFLINMPFKIYEGKEKDEEELDMRAVAASEEHDRWLNLAPAECQQFCRVLTLNGVPAITMPFFPPIPFGERQDSLKSIRKLLVAMGQEGFVYEEIHWKHFGRRGAKIYMRDLGSLRELEDGEDPKGIIENQIDSLQRRIGEHEWSSVNHDVIFT